MTRALVLTAAAVAFGAAAAPAHAVIVLDEGMAGIRVGTFDAEALAAAGKPTRSTYVRDRNGTLEARRFYALPQVEFRAKEVDPSDPDRTVTVITTTRGIERTADGVGVGTHERTLRAKIRGLECFTGRFRGPQRIRLCATKGKRVPNAEIGLDQTQFTLSLKSRLVTRVAVVRAYD